MAKKKKSAVEERLAEYKMFYPDTTVTRIGIDSNQTVSHKDGLELSKMVCHMTHSGLLQFVILKNKMYIFKSREFLKVADGFKKGARVRFHDPRTPDDHRESVILSEGMRYDGGIPFIWTENSPIVSSIETILPMRRFKKSFEQTTKIFKHSLIRTNLCNLIASYFIGCTGFLFDNYSTLFANLNNVGYPLQFILRPRS